MVTDETTISRTPDQTREDIAAGPSRARRLIDKAGSMTAPSRAAVREKTRQAGKQASNHWVPVLAGAVAVAGATTALLLQRRRAAQTRAALARTGRNRWRPGFLSR